MELQRIVRFEQGFDCMKFKCQWGHETCQPGEGGSHGRDALKIRWVVKGEHGAVQFLLSSGWYPEVVTPTFVFGEEYVASITRPPSPMDLGYHSKTPRYDGQEPIDKSCEYCDGLPCYYDGSTLNASKPMYCLVNGGDTALWEFLEQYYQYVFCEGEVPLVYEYPFAER